MTAPQEAVKPSDVSIAALQSLSVQECSPVSVFALSDRLLFALLLLLL